MGWGDCFVGAFGFCIRWLLVLAACGFLFGWRLYVLVFPALYVFGICFTVLRFVVGWDLEAGFGIGLFVVCCLWGFVGIGTLVSNRVFCVGYTRGLY